jgi:hypothetical protein
MVGYCLSVAGIDLHMAAWLVMTRAAVIGFICLHLPAKSELSVGPRAVVGAGQRWGDLSRRAGVGMPERGAPEAAVVHGFPLRLLVFNLPDQLVLRFAEGVGHVRVISNRH